MLCHHRITLALVYHLDCRHRGRPEKHHLVEISFFRLERMFHQVITNFVDIVRLVTHQQVDG